MPLHPAAPEDLPGLVAAYQQTTQAVIDLGRSCGDADFDLPTACPGWSVKDQISHVVGLESWLHTGETPSATVPHYAHVRNEAGRFVERSVEVRRTMLGAKVVDELETVVARRVEQFSAPEMTLETPVRGAWGPGPAGESLKTRILDIWTHEQDIRQALGRPGNLDSGGAAVFMSVLFDALPRLVARDAAIEPGNVVIFDVTGPVLGRAGVWVDPEEGGKPRGIPLFSGIAHDGDPHDTFTTITLSTDAITRRAAGRGGLDDIHFTVHGDDEVARRVLENLVFVP
ncbi:maleylpyruvate isomerase family mycothiol-dependent enzyme [Pedococcus sp. 5OH_020]|uniref:maleylpyruvate isomerase family mycothiol-dependent enzyme n=1 Tax=Pedococcus sp. 5OH_020 TaxID=2989814 RepID=UPI0022E9EE09|nr:maleylpyruvate isomerase family mycothiol-dependent enzyme [Pedococcus sp. 5OH_020]